MEGVAPEDAVTFSQGGSTFPTVKGAPVTVVCTDTEVETAETDPSRLESTTWLGESERAGIAGCPACVTLTDCPATSSVPVRADVEVLACTWMDTVPLPALESGAETVIQEACETADQEQVAPVETWTCAEPP